MLHLNVCWARPTWCRADGAAHSYPSRFRQRSDGSRTIRAASRRDRFVPVCFIDVLFHSQAALIGQCGAYITLSRPQDRPFVYSCIPAPNLMQLLAANDGVKLACPFCIRSRTSRINNPEGDVYEVRDRFEGGCSGSRGRACRLSGSEAPPS